MRKTWRDWVALVRGVAPAPVRSRMMRRKG
jgi:hypothetical protein